MTHYISLKNQKALIDSLDWDILVILDACRFDTFEILYREYLDGSLDKCWSLGSETPEWFRKTFDKFYNVVYFSANPYITSKETDKFYMVMDVWRFAWNDTYGTVLPSKMNEVVMSVSFRLPIIVHYIQPHFPYIGRVKLLSFLLHHPDRQLCGEQKKRIEFFKKHPEVVRVAYTENLKVVLSSVSELIDYFKDKRIVITADHGEAFGEEGVYFHPPKKDIKILREVPWFRVEGDAT